MRIIWWSFDCWTASPSQNHTHKRKEKKKGNTFVDFVYKFRWLEPTCMLLNWFTHLSFENLVIKLELFLPTHMLLNWWYWQLTQTNHKKKKKELTWKNKVKLLKYKILGILDKYHDFSSTSFSRGRLWKILSYFISDFPLLIIYKSQFLTGSKLETNKSHFFIFLIMNINTKKTCSLFTVKTIFT